MPSDRKPTKATAMRFLKDHSIAVIATKSEHGSLCTTPVTYLVSNANVLQFVTGDRTSKYYDITHNEEVALTVVDEAVSVAVNLTGRASIVREKEKLKAIFRKVGKVSQKNDEIPHVFKHQHGQPIAIAIEIIKIQYVDYSSDEIKPDKVIHNI